MSAHLRNFVSRLTCGLAVFLMPCCGPDAGAVSTGHGLLLRELNVCCCWFASSVARLGTLEAPSVIDLFPVLFDQVNHAGEQTACENFEDLAPETVSCNVSGLLRLDTSPSFEE
jgi:hypothetical protein